MLLLVASIVFCWATAVYAWSPGDRLVVTQSVADIWMRPEALKGPYAYPMGPSARDYGILRLLTQVLLGEELIVIEDTGSLLLRVSIPTQSFGVTACIGWVARSAVMSLPTGYRSTHVVTVPIASILVSPQQKAQEIMRLSAGTRVQVCAHSIDNKWATVIMPLGTNGYVRATQLEALPTASPTAALVRKKIVSRAALIAKLPHSNRPFVWGGRSIFDPIIATSQICGTDCSGLVGLLYNMCGLAVPRFCKELFALGTPIEPQVLEPGDLIFLMHRKLPVHVTMYLGFDQCIEAIGAPDVANTCIRTGTSAELFEHALIALKNGARVVESTPRVRYLQCASLLRDSEQIKRMYQLLCA